MTMLTLILTLFTSLARAEFPSTFPPRGVDEINQIIETYERGEVPEYRSVLRTHYRDDEVLECGSAAGIVAGLQLHSRLFSPEARRALVLGVGRLAAAALALGAHAGQFTSDDSDARQHLGYLYSRRYEPELNAVQLLQQIARGKKLKALADVAQEALQLVYTRADQIMSRKGTFKDAMYYDDEDIEMILNLMFTIDERAAVRDVRRYAERGVYAGLVQLYIVTRLSNTDPNLAWQTCHHALTDVIERKSSK